MAPPNLSFAARIELAVTTSLEETRTMSYLRQCLPPCCQTVQKYPVLLRWQLLWFHRSYNDNSFTKRPGGNEMYRHTSYQTTNYLLNLRIRFVMNSTKVRKLLFPLAGISTLFAWSHPCDTSSLLLLRRADGGSICGTPRFPLHG